MWLKVQFPDSSSTSEACLNLNREMATIQNSCSLSAIQYKIDLMQTTNRKKKGNENLFVFFFKECDKCNTANIYQSANCGMACLSGSTGS